ncbi:MAG: tRNA (guanosine(37)-N1)-methyltransferase TrmD [Spirochaetaceae bacterium]|nr:MAG: tRNA (guanosine(37)-N1)-methyltransferase TrmD [Spirochaetaceae bacterium]
MIFHILTLFPEIFEGYKSSSILGRALEQNQVELDLINIRDFARDRHRTCDDATYGGGPGMVLKPEPLAEALESVPGVKQKRGGRGGGIPVVYLTPSGKLWSQGLAQELAATPRVALICGRYEGIDQRIIDLFVTDEISVGDYILNGGEVAAMVVIDTVVRLLKGVITEGSLVEESFSQGLLEYPQYTRPAVFRGHRVPEILMSGHHAEIERWRREKSIEKTRRNRPDLQREQEP